MAGIKSGFTSPSVPVSFKGLSGGLNSSAGPLYLQPNEFSDLLNVDFDRFGSILKRNGYTALNTSAFNSDARWTGLNWFELASGTRYLVGTCGNKIAKMDDLDGTWDDVTGALTITAGNLTDFAIFRDTLIGTNGVDAPWKWTGSGNAAALTVPTDLTDAKYVEVFQSYTFLANVIVNGTAYKSRLYWSALDTIETWDAADFNDVSRDDGQTITGIKTLADRLVIFKERSIWLAFFTGNADVPFEFQKSASDVGCIAPFSIASMEGGIAFLATDGIYLFDGNNSYKISDRITNTLQTYNTTQFAQACAMHQQDKNTYWLALPGPAATTNNRVISWNVFNNSLSIYDGMAPSCMTTIFNSGIQERPYFGDYSGFVYRADTGRNDSPLNVETAINAYAYTRWQDFDDLCDQKGVPHVYIYFQNQNATLTFAWSYNFEEADQYTKTFTTSGGTSLYGVGVYGTAVYAGSGGNQERVDLIGRGRVVRFKFANAVLDEGFRIDGYGAFAHLETNQ
jgi:hypothetical protein